MTGEWPEHLTRQSTLIPFEVLSKPITIVGAGAIGSVTALTLAKMGFSHLTVWDPDTVAIENMNCQFYRFGDIGKTKVEALSDLIYEFTHVEIVPHAARWNTSCPLKDVVISAVDSMKVRASIWSKTKKRPRFFIDARMGAEVAASYAVDTADKAQVDAFERTLYSDSDAVQEPCTAKATMYTAMLIGGFVAKIVKDYVMNAPYVNLCLWDIRSNDMTAFRTEGEEHDDTI